MALETVRVHAVDTEAPPGDIASVSVRIFTTGEAFVTSAVTNALGIADVTLDGTLLGTQYHARFFKDTVSFTTPQVISVYSPAAGAPNGTNDFEVTGDLNAASAPSNPRLCRCYGYFRNIAGIAPQNLAFRFDTMYDPLIVDGVGVYGGAYYAEADSSGYMSLDLYRDSALKVSLAGEHRTSDDSEFQRKIVVPDRSTCNLLDLIFPVVISITWSPASPISVAVGASVDVYPTVTATNYQVLTGAAIDDVSYTSADTAVASVSAEATKLVVTGVSSGSTTITATRRDTSIVRVPDTIAGSTITINVA